MKAIYSVLLLICFVISFPLASSVNPYCYDTVTLVEVPKGIKKFFSKSKTTTKLERRCCAGFEMTSGDVCIPICSKGCPAKSSCIEPNVCECERGYNMVNNSFTNEAFCEAMCLNGFERNPKTNKCDYNPKKANESFADDESLSESTTQSKVEKLIHFENAPVTKGESEYENENENGFQTTTQNIEDDTTDSEEVYGTTIDFLEATTGTNNDCSLTGCMENAKCNTSGQCVCLSNFISYYDETLKDTFCVNFEDYVVLMESKNQEEDSDLNLALYLGIGIGCCGLIIIAILISYMKKQKGTMDIQEKNDLCCEYNTRNPPQDHVDC